MKTAQQTKATRRPKKGAVLAGIVILVVFLAGLFIINLDIIREGVSIEGIDVSGKNRQEAVRLLEARMEPILAREKLKLTYGSDIWEVGLEQIGGSFDYMGAVEEAYQMGRTGSPVERISEMLRVRKAGRNIGLRFRYDALALKAFVEGIDRVIATPPVDASITRVDGGFEVTPGRTGVGVDLDAALLHIDTDLTKKDFGWKTLPIVAREPEVTAEMLQHINTLWGQFHTVFNTAAKERSKNIEISAGAVEGILLKPGEVFSFNAVTGLRIAENGYLEAPVIVNGELTPGIGGGVCQVSSTLYNAALLANLEIVERHNHTIPSVYVTMGLDATVADRYLDLKFRNNTKGYLYLASWVSGDKVYAAVYGGKRDENIEVKLRTEVTEVLEVQPEIVIDYTLPPGGQVVEKEGRKGYRVKSFRQVIRDGRPEAEEMLSIDLYKPEKAVIRKGPQQSTQGGEGGIGEDKAS
ncbi:MAG: VanW family protein [Clostridia bacterium]|jgi:vancomycin resistance protein YoaR